MKTDLKRSRGFTTEIDLLYIMREEYHKGAFRLNGLEQQISEKLDACLLAICKDAISVTLQERKETVIDHIRDEITGVIDEFITQEGWTNELCAIPQFTPSKVYRTVSETLEFADSWASIVVRRTLKDTEYEDEDTLSDWNSESDDSEVTDSKSEEKVESPKVTNLPHQTSESQDVSGIDLAHRDEKYSQRTDNNPRTNIHPMMMHHLLGPRNPMKKLTTKTLKRHQQTSTSHQ